MKFISDFDEAYLDLSRKAVYRRAFNPMRLELDDYFPSEMIRVAKRLERRGLIKVSGEGEEMKMTVTETGKELVFKMNLDNLKKKSGEWDGKWRIVLFDIEETSKTARDKFRKYLNKLGLKQYQKSVFITPYECELEINYLKNIVNKSEGVKYGVLEKLGEDSELREWYGI